MHVGEQQSDFRAGQQVQAAQRQTVQELDDIQVIDHRVGELAEGLDGLAKSREHPAYPRGLPNAH
ncbi:MAG: hypothetical protein WAN93_11060 [Solirubrobacteraceae bacterium]